MVTRIGRVPTNYDDIKEEISRVLKNNTIISDLFPGDSSTFLVELLSAASAILAYKVDFGIRNSYLPTLYTKGAAYALASTLGYSPKRRQPSTVDVEFSGTAVVQAGSVFMIDSLPWICHEGFSVSSGQNVVKTLVQASRVTETFKGNGRRFQSFSLSYGPSVINESLSVSVNGVNWRKSESFIFDVGSDLKIYVERFDSRGNLLILFGDGVYGDIPPANSEIVISYLITEGDAGNGIPPGREVVPGFSLLPSQSLYGKTITPSSGGSQEDSVDSIKFVAPKFFAAAGRAVRRDDYIYHLLKNTQVVSASVVGEYENIRDGGYQDFTLMNRIDVSFVRSSINKSEMSITTSSSQYTYNITTQNVPIYSGSFVAEELSPTGEKFVDVNGYIIPTVNVNNAFVGGIVLSDDPSASNAFNSSDIAWETGVHLNEQSRVAVGYTFSSPKKIVALRFKVSTMRTLFDRFSAPARVVVFGSNSASPPISPLPDPSIWTYVGSSRIRRLSKVLGTDWIPLQNPGLYKSYCIIFSGVSVSGGPFKVSSIQGVEESNCGTIDYYNGNISIIYHSQPQTGVFMIASFLYGDFTKSQAQEILQSVESVKPIQVRLHYVRPKVLRLNVDISAYYNPLFKIRGLQKEVDDSIRKFFSLKFDSLGKKFFKSSLLSYLSKIPGMDSVEIKSPHDDTDLAFNEFIVPDVVNISWMPSPSSRG